MIVLCKQKLFLKIFHVLPLLLCFDPPPWRGNIYDVVKTEPHPVASRSNKPQLWILDIVRKFCQRITVFLSKDFQCVNIFSFQRPPPPALSPSMIYVGLAA